MYSNNEFPTNSPFLQGLRVLLVDNNADSCDLMKQMLQPYGVEVQAASLAQQALEIFVQMGVTITSAAMQVANMMFAEKTLAQIEQMSASEQTQVMCDLINHTDTPICRTYSYFGMNVKLGFWYQLSEWMKQGIVASIPEGYKLSTVLHWSDS